MKKAKWIFSVNVDRVPPLGYMGTKAGQYLFGNGMKFQKELKAELMPEVDLEFISYDIREPKVLDADLIIYTDVDEKYLDEETKKKGFSIPYNLYFTKDTEKIREYVIANVTKIAN
ncbi:hypothetical protein IGK28_002131 [Enterococcus sp. DIV0182]|uniref:hypothetical protein n=1 Tax=Enterococcus TaxID=1350 RepID=UPI0039A677E8